MHFICGPDGVVNRSKNLRGIREYVSKNAIEVLSISDNEGEGSLGIIFENGASFFIKFASFEVLKIMVREWRNVYGAPLMVDGKSQGVVSKKNPALK